MSSSPTNPSIEEVLARHDVFKSLKPDHRSALASRAERGSCAAGTTLFKTGEMALRFYVVESGAVRLEAYAPAGGSMSIGLIGPDEILGWSWLFPPYDWHFNAVATEPVRFVAFDASHVRKLCESDHEFGYELLKRFSQIMLSRLIATRYQVLELRGETER